jgi:hypothetical protein
MVRPSQYPASAEIVEKAIWCEFPEDCPYMEFRLIYNGPLKAAGGGKGGGRSNEKHRIRKALHKQLKQLWQTIPNLKMRTDIHSILHAPPSVPNETGARTVIMAASLAQPSLLARLGHNFDRCGYKFVPLVSNELKLSCGLDILFLRRDMPGTPLIKSGGDIDNRLKVLLDALRIPTDCSELKGSVKDIDEEPYFYCLLEDDVLISDLSVTTDSLLTPYAIGEESDVHLVIKVKVRPTDFSFENLAFAM